MSRKKQKYFYNSHTLRYERVEKSWSRRLLTIGEYFLAGLIFSALGMFLVYKYVDSPKEKQLKEEINALLFQYDILQKQMKQMDIVLDDLEERDNNIYRVLFEAEPIHSEDRINAFADMKRYKAFENYNYSNLMTNTTQKIDQLARRLYSQSKSYDYIIKEVKNKSKLLSSVPAIQPVANKDLKRMASGYGYRIHPIYKTTKMHAGMDFAAPIGTEVYATGDGVVRRAGKQQGFGNCIIINHGYGYETLYAHLSKIATKAGEQVKRGELIGYVGSTGMSTGPHLHYEVHKKGTPVNPIEFYFNDLTPEEYEKMLEMSSNINQSFD